MPPRKSHHHNQKPIYQAKATFASDSPQQQSPQHQQQVYKPKQQAQQKQQQQYQPSSQKQGSGNQPGFGGPMNPQQQFLQQPQMMMMPHLENLNQMDNSQLESIVVQLLTMCGPDIMNQVGGQGYGPGGGRGSQGGQFQQPNIHHKGGHQGQQYQQRNQGQYQPRYNQQQPFSQPQMPFGALGAFPPVGTMTPQLAMQPAFIPSKRKDSINPDDPSQTSDTSTQGSVQSVPTAKDFPLMDGAFPPQTHKITTNLCETHFPEPILYHLDKPVCKKCIPEFLIQQQNQRKRGGAPKALSKNQITDLARMLGISSMALNAYQSEKNMISRSLQKIEEFQKDLKYFERELNERQEQSDQYLKDLPEQMSGMFNHLEQLVNDQEGNFYQDINQTIKKQQQAIIKDNQSKVPGFIQRLQLKYNELQNSVQIASQQGVDSLIPTLEQYLNVFSDLDAEFEKYFNEFESFGRLQRLLEKDPNEIVKSFGDLVEGNLRVDYNVKSSFIPQIGTHRLHSFQWNQKHLQVYKVKTGVFEKRAVQMDHEVPLYSRSIANDRGQIYLIGGYIKRENKYLKSCYRYDELFGQLEKRADCFYPHADHSVCSIESFIYVAGTFYNNQVYPFCERYDSQKNKWKVIAPMNIPRSGGAFCSFKNQYLFLFGGRVDQRRIVDTIEAYDIKRNAWQEIPLDDCDKSKWIPAYMSNAYQITDKEIMIFGGKSALTFQIFDGVFIFDLERMVIKERGSLVNPCSFMNTSLVFNHQLYAFGNDTYIHRYNIPEQKWSVIPKNFQ